jgi:hypothetical protein
VSEVGEFVVLDIRGEYEAKANPTRIANSRWTDWTGGGQSRSEFRRGHRCLTGLARWFRPNLQDAVVVFPIFSRWDFLSQTPMVGDFLVFNSLKIAVGASFALNRSYGGNEHEISLS